MIEPDSITDISNRFKTKELESSNSSSWLALLVAASFVIIAATITVSLQHKLTKRLNDLNNQ